MHLARRQSLRRRRLGARGRLAVITSGGPNPMDVAVVVPRGSPPVFSTPLAPKLRTFPSNPSASTSCRSIPRIVLVVVLVLVLEWQTGSRTRTRTRTIDRPAMFACAALPPSTSGCTLRIQAVIASLERMDRIATIKVNSEFRKESYQLGPRKGTVPLPRISSNTCLALGSLPRARGSKDGSSCASKLCRLASNCAS